ncbi:spore coat U domain-containing protein [Erwinia pyri]|uniref:Spore coat U domain-containing protein n=1 Tax=Erwinia pyri TaxID=3062598 RepID=A0AA50DKN4_9GAMM|nr:spore coat U domain-containing protein [Erwinia sp. DE2]WLS79585.1 spore coat U domain-containing protein [Erwinia sp. DE2]
MKRLLSGLLLLLLMAFTLPGQAACTLPSATASFGTASSFAINTTASATTANVLVNCGTGSVLSLLSTDYVRLQLASATFSSGTRGALKVISTGTDAIPLRACTDTACSNELSIGGAATTYSQAQLLNLLGLGGGQNFSIPLYLRTVPGQVVAAGTYTVTLNILVNYNICTGLGAVGLCLLGNQQTGSGTVPITTTLIVTNDCTTITAPNISFGSAPLVSSFNTVSQSINVICTKGSTYTVGISNGNHAVGAQRYMASGSTLLAYEIYKSATTTRWGATGTERVSSTGANSISTDGLTRTFNYTARILTTQSTPVAGSYSDSVVVDLSF